MRIWVYGDSSKQIQNMIEGTVGACDIVIGSSVCAEEYSEFPQSGLTPAVSAAMRGELDLLLIPTFELLGGKAEIKQIVALFQNYGVSVKSVSSSGINSS